MAYTIFNALFTYIYLLVLLWIAWRIYRNGEKRNAREEKRDEIATDVTRASAESARQSAESARIAVETVHNLLALRAKADEPE
jgi:cbb3-type cytochrome oxidase subunit 3